MKKSGDSTYPCHSPMASGCDLTFPTWTQTSEQECSILIASNRRASTQYSRKHSPYLFTRNPVVCFLEFDKSCVDVFGILLTFFKNLMSSENHTGCHSALVQLFRGIFFKALGNVMSNYLKLSKKCRGPHVARVFENPSFPSAAVLVIQLTSTRMSTSWRGDSPHATLYS